jgi:hypothetical protein
MSSVADKTVVPLRDYGARDVGDQVSKTFSSMLDRLASEVQNWTSKARTAAKTTDGFVRSSPWQTAGAVALAGLAAGVLVSRSRARRAAHANADAAATHAASEMSGG